jgi:hypothetical protein
MATLSDGELLKKTLRTTLVMLGTTTLWVGALSGGVFMVTGPSSSAEPESKVEKPATGSPAALVPGPSPRQTDMANPRRGAHQPRPMTKPGAPKAGDPL